MSAHPSKIGETDSDTLPLTEKAQQALLGHLLSGDQRAQKLGEYVEEFHFLHPYVAKAYGALKRFHSAHGKWLNADELVACHEIDWKLEKRERENVVRAINDCLEQKSVVGMEIITVEVARWDVVVKFQKLAKEAVKLFNGGRVFEAARLLGMEIPNGPGGLPFRTAAEFMALPDEETPWLLEDLVPAGGIFAIGGASNAGKSWVALGLFVKPLLEKGIKVAYITPEGSVAGWKARLSSLGIGYNENLYLLHQHTLPLGGRDQEKADASVDSICASIEQHGFQVVFLDPQTNFLGDADENQAGDMAQVRDRIVEIRNRTSCSVGVIAHTPKGKWDDANEEPSLSWFRGSGVSAASFDQAFIVRFHDSNTDTQDQNIIVDRNSFDTVKVRDGALWLHDEVTMTRVHQGRKLINVDFERTPKDNSPAAKQVRQEQHQERKVSSLAVGLYEMVARGSKDGVSWASVKTCIPCSANLHSTVKSFAVKNDWIREEPVPGKSQALLLKLGNERPPLSSPRI